MDAYTFTVPMSVLIGVPSFIAAIIGGLSFRKWWKGYAIRATEARRVEREERAERAERYRQQDLEAKQKKEAEEKEDMPEEWRTLLVALKNMPRTTCTTLQFVYFQQCMQDKPYPKISVVGANHFLVYFDAYSHDNRRAVAKEIAPHLDIGETWLDKSSSMSNLDKSKSRGEPIA